MSLRHFHGSIYPAVARDFLRAAAGSNLEESQVTLTRAFLLTINSMQGIRNITAGRGFIHPERDLRQPQHSQGRDLATGVEEGGTEDGFDCGSHDHSGDIFPLTWVVTNVTIETFKESLPGKMRIADSHGDNTVTLS